MNITKRLFAYPVLSDEKDDYNTCVFQVNSSCNMQGANTLRLSFEIEMNCPEIEEMIDDGRAEYVFHMECSRTAFRQIKKTISKELYVDIPIGRVNGELELVAFIIAKKDILGFKAADWNDDYKDYSFMVRQGSILGYQNLDNLDITKNFEEFTNANSIFTVYKKYVDEKHLDVNMDSEKIRIGLPAKEYDIFANCSNNYKEAQAILNSIVILPAMVFIVEELKQEEGLEQYQHREWFIALEKSYKKRGIVFQEEISRADKSSLELAQEAMDYPISEALIEIPRLLAGEEE